MTREALAAHLARVKSDLEILRDFGLGFALCHRDLYETREAIKAEQRKVARLIDSLPEVSLVRHECRLAAEITEMAMEVVRTSDSPEATLEALGKYAEYQRLRAEEAS